MIVTFSIFLISLGIIGVLVGRRLATRPSSIASETGEMWYRLDVPALQHYLWSTFLFMSRYLLVITVIRGLLFVEKGSRALAGKLHTFIEKTMHYHHTHH